MQRTIARPQPRPSREQVRARIIAKADELFRARGYEKTTIATIAEELDMSTSNIYKFFASKNAVIEATAEQSIEDLRSTVLLAAHDRGTALERIENITLAIVESHRRRFENEINLYELIIMANAKKWGCVRRWKSTLRDIVAQLIEDGIRTGEFRSVDSGQSAEIILDSLMVFLHPLFLSEWSPAETERRARAHVKFIGRALQ
ncbi:TetR family transcriptional regulator [Allostella vacuolata]|nr:TetR family transcriptional regulator [Stella vacuolata]